MQNRAFPLALRPVAEGRPYILPAVCDTHGVLGRVKRLERSNASAEICRLVVQTAFKRRSNDVQTFRALSNGAKRGKNKAPFQGQMQVGLDLNSDLDLDSGASLRGGGGRESRCCCYWPRSNALHRKPKAALYFIAVVVAS
jgi:hypothetical protein